MKILAVNIALRPNAVRKLFPIGLGYILTAVKNAGYTFDLLDLDADRRTPEKTEQFLKKNKYDVIMFGCIVTGYKYVKWLSSVIKEAHPGTTIIVGNSVASSIPDILLSRTGTDIAVMGEGEVTIIELLRALGEKGISAASAVFVTGKGERSFAPLSAPLSWISMQYRGSIGRYSISGHILTAYQRRWENRFPRYPATRSVLCRSTRHGGARSNAHSATMFS